MRMNAAIWSIFWKACRQNSIPYPSCCETAQTKKPPKPEAFFYILDIGSPNKGLHLEAKLTHPLHKLFEKIAQIVRREQAQRVGSEVGNHQRNQDE